jgi:hypothetical protein
MPTRSSLLALALCVTLPAVACDDPPVSEVPAVVVREAPDVPWPSVAFEGDIEGPDLVAAIVGDCFAGGATASETSLEYIDHAPDGDDQQAVEMCFRWVAHTDVADCIRRGLIKAGLDPVPQDAP